MTPLMQSLRDTARDAPQPLAELLTMAGKAIEAATDELRANAKVFRQYEASHEEKYETWCKKYPHRIIPKTVQERKTKAETNRVLARSTEAVIEKLAAYRPGR